MKGTIIINPYDAFPIQKRKVERMVTEFAALGVSTDVLANDGFVAYVEGGEIKCNLQTDFVLYFDKERIAAKLIEKAGIPVFNSAAATEICDDKMLTHTVLADCGILMPDTVAGPLCYNSEGRVTDEYLRRATETLGLPLVVKECHGSFGEQVYLCRTKSELKTVIDKIKNKPYLLQRYESCSSGRDMRVIVIGGKAVCGMVRVSRNDFRSNAAMGGKCVGVVVPKDVAAICEKAAQIIGLDFCGVDVLLTDPPKLCEVNSNAMFEAMEQATGFNVAKAYAEHIVKRVETMDQNKNQRREKWN